MAESNRKQAGNSDCFVPPAEQPAWRIAIMPRLRYAPFGGSSSELHLATASDQ
jgi:hypothetical protein